MILYIVYREIVYLISTTKDDSIKTKRIVTLSAKDNKSTSLTFTNGAVIIDTLLVKSQKTGSSFDSVLVVRKDSVYRIPRDSVFNIYNKDDSIRSKRTVVLHTQRVLPKRIILYISRRVLSMWILCY